MQNRIITRAKELLQDQTVNRVLGYKRGEFVYDVSPAVFTTAKEIDESFVYDDFCGANLSKYLVKESRKEGKVLVILKPCDTYSFNQLVREHRIVRENVYVIGVPCEGTTDIEKIKSTGISGITNITSKDDKFIIETIYGKQTVLKKDVVADRCQTCKSKKHVVYDELIGEEVEENNAERFTMVDKLDNMTADERFAFWQNELSKCIRCNACRNACPCCTCEHCVFEVDASSANAQRAEASFGDDMYHIVRAFHVAGRCTDCGECSRVCPQHIPLHLLNRKIIKDINELYGDYQAGESLDSLCPLTDYKQEDSDPKIIHERGVN